MHATFGDRVVGKKSTKRQAPPPGATLRSLLLDLRFVMKGFHVLLQVAATNDEIPATANGARYAWRGLKHRTIGSY